MSDVYKATKYRQTSNKTSNGYKKEDVYRATEYRLTNSSNVLVQSADANSDGTVNIKDLVRAKKMTNNSPTPQTREINQQSTNTLKNFLLSSSYYGNFAKPKQTDITTVDLSALKQELYRLENKYSQYSALKKERDDYYNNLVNKTGRGLVSGSLAEYNAKKDKKYLEYNAKLEKFGDIETQLTQKKAQYDYLEKASYYAQFPNGEAVSTNKKKVAFRSWGSTADWEYEYINDINGFRDWEDTTAKDAGGVSKYKKYHHMSKREIGIYNYLYAEKGKKAAKEFLEFIDEDLESRLHLKNMEGVRKFADENPFLSAALSVPANVAAAGEQVINSADYLITGDMKRNKAADGANILRGAMSEKVNLEIGDWDAFDFVYNTVMSAADSLVMAPLGTVGAVTLGLSAAASSTNDILERGGTNSQAFWGGIAAGVFEGFFEKFSISQLDSMQDGMVKGFKDYAKNIGKSMLTNASEETATEIANILWDYANNGGISQYALLVEEYIANGETEESAKKKAAQKLGWQIAEAGASGMLMGFGFGSLSSASAYKNYKNSPQYQKAKTNSEILQMVDKVKNGDFKANDKVYLENVTSDVAATIKEITGIDVSGFKVAIEARQIEHILKDHGAEGKSDNSMADDVDIAKMEYILSKPDDIRKAGKTRAYSYMKNGNNKTADTVLYEKVLDENSYYVVQAVPDTKAKTLYIVSAFIGKSGYKKEASQLTDVNNPSATSENGSAIAQSEALQTTDAKSLGVTPNSETVNASSDITVPQNVQHVNNIISTEQRNNTQADPNGPANFMPENDSEQSRKEKELAKGLRERRHIDKDEQDFIERICNKLGVKMQFIHITPELLAKKGYKFEGGLLPDGFYDKDTDTLYIGFTVIDPVKFIFKHELTHFLEKDIAKYNDLANSIMDSNIFKEWVKGMGYDSVSEYNASIVEQYSTADKTFGEYEANLEIVANFVGSNMFGDKNQINRLLESFNAVDRNRFLQFIIDFISSIRAKLNGEIQIDAELKALEEQYAKLLKETVEKNNPQNDKGIKKASKQSGGVQYSIAKDLVYNDYCKKIEDIAVNDDVSEKGQYIEVSQQTPEILINKANANNLPMAIQFDVAYLETRHDGKIKGNYHNLGAERMKNLPELLENPEFIIKLPNGRLNVIVNMSTDKGNRSLVSIELEQAKQVNGKFNKYNLIITAFGAKTSYLDKIINNPDNQVLYKKTTESQGTDQLHKRLDGINDSVSNNRISQNNSTVNNKYIQESENNSKGNIQFSFARADNASLIEEAEAIEKEMQAEKKSKEAIRKKIWNKTQLIRDSSGVWVYEIPDNKMEVYLDGDAIKPIETDYEEYLALTKLKRMTPEKRKRHSQLYDKYGPPWNKKFKLEDFIRHDELFAKYPQLKEYTVEICDLGSDRNGDFNPETKTIRIHRNLVEEAKKFKAEAKDWLDLEFSDVALKETLTHEIQHAIQDIDERENGASIEYWKNEFIAGRMPINYKTGKPYTPEEAYAFTKGEYEARASEKRLMDGEWGRKNTVPDLGWGKTISAKKPVTVGGLKFSIPTNSEYMSAVKENDTDKLQEMVDNKARAEGYTERLYHQTGADFTEFNTDNQKAGKFDWELPTGTFLKPSKDDIGLEGKKQMELYARIQNPLNFKDRADAQRFWRENIPGYEKAANEVIKIDIEYSEKVHDATNAARKYLKEWKQNNPDSNSRDIYKDSEYLRLKDIEDSIADEWEAKSNKASLVAKKLIDKYISENDYDGIIVEKDQDGIKHQTKTYIVFDSNQLKDAAPVTYDDNGNVISLSQRFDEGKKDIRFSAPGVISPEILLERYENGEITRQEYLDLISRKKTLNPVEIANLKEEDADTTPPVNRRRGESEGDKESKFYESIQKSSLFDETFKEETKKDSFIQKYKSVTNKEILAKAVKEIDEGGQRYVEQWWNKKAEEASLIDRAVGFILMDRYQRIGDYKSAASATVKVREMGTIGGQGVQLFSIIGRLDPNSMQAYAQQTLDKALKKLTDVKTQEWIDKNQSKFNLTKDDIEFIRRHTLQAALFEDGTRPKAIALAKICARIQDKIPPNIGQSFVAFKRNAMLFNLRTMLRNINGNLGMIPVFIASDFFGTIIDKTIAKKTNVRTTGNFKIQGSGTALKKGLYESWDDFKRGMRTKQEELNRFDTNILHSGKNFNDNGEGLFGTGALKKQLNDIAKFLNKIDNFTSFCLEAGDRPTFEFWLNNSLNNQLRLNNVDVPTPEMLEIAKQEALQRTWQDDNMFSRSISQWKEIFNRMHLPGVKYGLGDFIFDFVKTPTNIAKAIAEFSPVGFTFAANNARKLKLAVDKGRFTPQLQKEFVRSMSNAITGTLIYALVAIGAGLGVVKLSGDGDDDKDASNYEKYIMGIPPYSIEFFGVNISYDWMQPFGSILAVVADFRENQKANPDGDAAYAIFEAIKAGGKVFAQQSFIQSLYDLCSSDDWIEGIGTILLAEPAKYIPQALSQFGSYSDKYKRTSYDYSSGFKSAINKVIAKIPGLRTKLPKQVNILGEDIENTQYLNAWEAFASPWNTYPKSSSEVIGEIYDLYKATGENSVMPRTAPNYFEVKDNKIVFTPEEKAEFQRNIGKRSAEMLGLLFDSNEYKNLSDNEKVKVIGKIYQFAYDKAKSEWKYDYETLSAIAGENKNGDPALTESEYNKLPQEAREMIAQEKFLSKTEIRYMNNYKSLIQYYIRQATK